MEKEPEKKSQKITITPGEGDLKLEKPLPLFRGDLKFFAGPPEPDGSPTYTLYDPVRAQFFKINWAESLVFKLLTPGMTMPQLIKAIELHSTLKVTAEELENMFQDASASGLLSSSPTSEQLSMAAEKQKIGIFKWLLYHYLYIRIPLVKPDAFLTRTLPYVKPLFSKPAFVIYAVLILIGLFHLINRFDEFLHTFTYFFNAKGILIYALGISAVKIIHEFSHAYTAKYYNIRVPTMGVALIVFWPVLYTDVTDSWKLAKRSQRLAISFAGILAELLLAGISTLAWSITSPGELQSLFFVISSVTWISTLAVNLNPAMRFDGYYLMSDLWGIDNLQPRAFAMTRWQLRKWLLGINVDPPETNISSKRIIGMMIYSLYTWIYRLVLYTAIAIFVYKEFTKVLGIFLFLVEVFVFILWPFASEAAQLYRLRKFININKRSAVTMSFVTLFLLWLIVPWPHKESFPAITDPLGQQVIYVPISSKVEKIFVKRGEVLKNNQPIINLSFPPLLVEIAQSNIDRETANREAQIAAETEEGRVEFSEKVAAEMAEEAKMRALLKIEEQLKVKADIPGELYFWDETLSVGQFLQKDQLIGKVANLEKMQVMSFVPEILIKDLAIGQKVVFRLKSTQETFPGYIREINPIRNRTLNYKQLASVYGGDLPITQDPSGKLIIVESYYIVTVELDKLKSPLKVGEVGYIDARGPWRSKIVYFLRRLQSIIWSEGTF